MQNQSGIRWTAAGWALWVVLMAQAASASDGVIEINATRTQQGGVTSSDGPGVPVTIDSPGSYQLTSNLTPSLGPIGVIIADPENFTVIEITADDVTLDLGGFAIQGPGAAGTGDGVRSTGANTVVRNGTITGVGADGIDLGDGARVSDCTVADNGEDGIETGAHGMVRNCTSKSNAGYGLSLGNNSGFTDNLLADNNGGDANPQIKQKGRPIFEMGSNVCGTSTTCSIDAPSQKVVFIVDIGGGGGASLGGLPGAAVFCGMAANAAGLTGTFLPWLSDGVADPDTRFSKSAGPYVLTTGVTVALDWADLTDGSLLTAINVDQFMGVPTATRVWTNVSTDGTTTGVAPTVDHCRDWAPLLGSDTGRAGAVNATDATWTALGTELCSRDNTALYCFEQ